MSAYVIVDVQVNDLEKYKAYKKLTPETIAAFNGKFIVRGGSMEVIEGSWKPGRIVVLEFPSMKHARNWWDSEQYSKAKALRQKAATTNMIFVEGT